MDTKEIWCMLEPCLRNRYPEGAVVSPPARSVVFDDAGAFRTHLVEVHDFSIDEAMWLGRASIHRADGPTHTWDHYRIIARSQQVGHMVERHERDPEDAAVWADARGDEDA